MSVQQPIWMSDTRWRESGRSIKLGPLDGRLVIFLVGYFMAPSYFLFFLAIGAIAFFYGLEYVGYTLPNAFRKCGLFISGNKKSGVHYWRRTKLRL